MERTFFMLGGCQRWAWKLGAVETAADSRGGLWVGAFAQHLERAGLEVVGGVLDAEAQDVEPQLLELGRRRHVWLVVRAIGSGRRLWEAIECSGVQKGVCYVGGGGRGGVGVVRMGGFEVSVA